MKIFANALVLEIVKPVIGSDAVVVSKLPPDLTSRLPLIFVRAPSGEGKDPEFANYISVVADCYVDEDEPACFALADRVDGAFLNAWKNQTVYDHGHVSSYECTTTPFDFPDPQQADGLVRYTAEWRLLCRPPVS